jgi:hypothetical protein
MWVVLESKDPRANGRLNAIDTLLCIALDLMLPKPKDHPASSPQASEIPLVATSIALNFLFPVRRQLVPPLRKSPAVPVVAVDEHNNPCAYEYEIRLAGEPSSMLPEPEPASVEQATDGQLGPSILAPDQRHGPTTLRRREVVHKCLNECRALLLLVYHLEDLSTAR